MNTKRIECLALDIKDEAQLKFAPVLCESKGSFTFLFRLKNNLLSMPVSLKIPE